jgi:cyanate lyase
MQKRWSGFFEAAPRAAEQEAGMLRAELTEKILDIKREKGWTWKYICAEIGGMSPILITGALLGQMKLTKPQAGKAAELFGLSKSEEAMLNEVPLRGTSLPPTDPLIYRFYELVMVNGPAWKALIEEEFGDGIMSAIDFDLQMERLPNPKGDRVKITMSGKFLPYKYYGNGGNVPTTASRRNRRGQWPRVQGRPAVRARSMAVSAYAMLARKFGRHSPRTWSSSDAEHGRYRQPGAARNCLEPARWGRVGICRDAIAGLVYAKYIDGLRGGRHRRRRDVRRDRHPAQRQGRRRSASECCCRGDTRIRRLVLRSEPDPARTPVQVVAQCP